MPYLQNPPLPVCQVQERPLAGTVVGGQQTVAALGYCGGQAAWGCFSPYCYYCETFRFTWTNLYPIPYQKELQSKQRFLSSTVTVTKHLCVSLFGKILALRKGGQDNTAERKKIASTCDKIFPFSHLQWGNLSTFLATISLLSKSDTLKNKIVSGTSTGQLASWGKLPLYILRTG